MTRLAFVGTGTMGDPMARRLLGAGHQVTVHDRSDVAVERLMSVGATSAPSAAAAAAGAEAVFLSLPGPDQVHDAVAGPDGVLAAEPPPALIVDLSTNSPEVVAELAAACSAVGVGFLDAPVSGGLAKAVDGTLTVMVGGSEASFAQAEPLLASLGTTIVRVGESGAGTAAKLVNNQLFLAAGLLVQEAYVLGGALGLSPDALHAIIATSSAGPYAKLAPLVLGRRFNDVIFRLDIAAKDVRLAASAAATAGVSVPLTDAASEVYAAAVEHGDGELVFHATLRELERRAGLELPPLSRPPRPAPAPGGPA